jgi:hypothetical protein
MGGPIERRGNSLIVFKTETEKLELLQSYLNPKISDEKIKAIDPRFMKSSGEFKAEKARLQLKGVVGYDPNMIAQYPFKPFDIRLAYLDANLQPLFSRPSPELIHHRKVWTASLSLDISC